MYGCRPRDTNAPAWEHQLARSAPSLIAILGGTVVVVSLANSFRDVETLGVGLLPATSLGICLVLSAGLLGLSHWLADSDLSVTDTWTVVRWCPGGMLGFGALAALTVGLRLAEGRIVGEAAFGLIVMGSGGGVAGIYYARANRTAREADHRRDALVFLNSYLRHNVLNAAQVIQGYATLLRRRGDEPDEYSTRSNAVATPSRRSSRT
jgi:hypothetical protein